ncbi:hypothetical protein DY000_02015938 [Brassica cretica]|uniref:Uncharacterized protein n=1 Tax=Brassica cretica TaxID=69181 RepID=A0ABQ7D288_BRACR|nr:hypothetical protein DY000_02015938 [Brassica cretica]
MPERQTINGRNLDNSPHPIDIESGPSPEDIVRCCIKSIKTMGSRHQNKSSPSGAISTDPPVSEDYFLKTSRFPRINLQVQQDQHMKPLRALDSRQESSGTTSSYTMYVDTLG